MRVDVTDPRALDNAIHNAMPDVTYYLAGVSKRGSREALSSAVGVSVAGSAHALTASAQHAPGSRFCLSAAASSTGRRRNPRNEAADIAPTDVYGAAKLAAERRFGPCRGGQRASGSRSAVQPHWAWAEGGVPGADRRKPVARGAVGNGPLSPSARSTTSGISVTCATSSAPTARSPHLRDGTWNMTSGTGMVIGEVINLMVSLAGVQVEVSSSPPAAPSGPKSLVGDATRLRGLGWGPEHPLGETLREILDGTCRRARPGRRCQAARSTSRRLSSDRGSTASPG